MAHLLLLIAVAGLGFSSRHFYLHLKNKQKRSLHEKKLEVWEGEGGSVPVAPDRAAAQVAPRRPSTPSP